VATLKLASQFDAERPNNWVHPWGNHLDVAAKLARSCRNFAADETRPENHNSSARHKCCAKGNGIVKRANCVTPGQLRVAHLQALRPKSGGNNESRVWVHLTVRIGHGSVFKICRLSPGAQNPVDVCGCGSLSEGNSLVSNLVGENFFA
jgi:hypothetical protein